MKIAQIAPIFERIPPVRHGGIERIVYSLTEELVSRGHDVTLFASGDSITQAQLVSTSPKPLDTLNTKDWLATNPDIMRHLGAAYEVQNQFDLIHDHNDYLSLPMANLSQTPVVMTLHMPLDSARKRIFETLQNPYLVSISKAQIPDPFRLNYIGNVYNGQKMDNYPFSKITGKYLLYVGTISQEKGTHLAIKVALALDLPLIIAAKLNSKDRGYYNDYIKPKLSQKIRWIGEVGEKRRNSLMSRALCFLHPVTWSEPFGLTLIEAMACGTPVIGFNRGSIPEIIVNGKTGFVVKNISQMIRAVRKVDKINRSDCRQYALETFNIKNMVDGYEKVYEKVLSLKQQTEIQKKARWEFVYQNQFYAEIPSVTKPKLKN